MPFCPITIRAEEREGSLAVEFMPGALEGVSGTTGYLPAAGSVDGDLAE